MTTTDTAPTVEGSTVRTSRERRQPIGQYTYRKGRELRYLLGSLVAALVLTGYNVAGGPRYFEDEGTYTAQAMSVWDFALSPYYYTFDHPPLAWLQMAPFISAAHALGISDTAVSSARVVSVIAVTLIVGLMYVIARRLLIPRPIVVGALLLFLLSPLTQDYMRRVYIDNVSMIWVMVAFAVALAPGRYKWNYGLAGMALGVAVISKETMLLFAPALLLAVYTYARRDESWRAVGSTTLGGTIIGLAYPLWALTQERLGGLINAIEYQLSGRVGSGSMFETGTARDTIVTRWLDLDSTFVYAGLACAVILLASKRHRWIGLATLLPLVQVLRSDGYLPFMMIIMFLPFMALSIASVVSLAWSKFGNARQATALVAAAAVALAGLAVVRINTPMYLGDANAADDAAVRWLEQNTAPNTRILVDDVAFAELRRNGRTDPWGQAVYVYKLDLDPTAKTEIDNGWRDIEYVLDTPMMRGALSDPSLVEANIAYTNSKEVVTFGEGDSLVTIRKVQPNA